MHGCHINHVEANTILPDGLEFRKLLKNLIVNLFQRGNRLVMAAQEIDKAISLKLFTAVVKRDVLVTSLQLGPQDGIS